MNTVAHSPTRKRPVNLTLSDELVQQARSMTSNLSAVVETLLADYVRQQTQAQQSRRQEATLTAQAWNNFNAGTGSPAGMVIRSLAAFSSCFFIGAFCCSRVIVDPSPPSAAGTNGGCFDGVVGVV